tara:strand:- start:335 stop:925 length:591 start_codon:yes stop_codon:yes gene_type:complete
MPNQALQHTEEVLEPGTEFRGFDIDLMQHDKRDYSFYSGALYRRSINRAQSDSREIEPDCYHPLDSRPIHDGRKANEKTCDRVIDFPDVFRPRVYGERSVSTLQEWECVIDDLDNENVIAQAISLIEDSPEKHILTIPITEFSPLDHAKLHRGTVFRLIVGFAKKANGARSREAICYLRKSNNNLHSAENFDFTGL